MTLDLPCQFPGQSRQTPEIRPCRLLSHLHACDVKDNWRFVPEFRNACKKQQHSYQHVALMNTGTQLLQ